MADRIQMIEIRITRAEGPRAGPIPVGKTFTFSDWQTAQHFLMRLCLSMSKDQLGYDKVDFEVEFQDEGVYKGRYDAAHPESRSHENPDLRWRIRTYLGYLAGDDACKPRQFTAEQWEANKRNNAKFADEARHFLTTYDV